MSTSQRNLPLAIAVAALLLVGMPLSLLLLFLPASTPSCGSAATGVSTGAGAAGGGGLNPAAGKVVALAEYNAGFRGNDLVEMAAVAFAESGWDPNVGNSSGHEGLWETTESQFQGIDPGGDIHNPDDSAKVALAQWLDHLKPTPEGAGGGPDPSPGPFTGHAPVINDTDTVDGGLPLNIPEEPWQDWPPSPANNGYQQAIAFLNANIGGWNLPADWATGTTKGVGTAGNGPAPQPVSSSSDCSAASVSYSGYVNPMPGATISRIDEGSDYTLGPRSFLAPADSKIVYSANIPSGAPPNWFMGGEVSGQILDGPLQGKVWYISEGVLPAPGIHAGSVIKAGQQVTTNVASYYNGIVGNVEAGWAEPANADPAWPLAQITGGYTECHVTAAGLSWNDFAHKLGVVQDFEDQGACEQVMGSSAQVTGMGYPPPLAPSGVGG